MSAEVRGRCLRPLAVVAENRRKVGIGFKETVVEIKQLAERLKFQKDFIHVFLYSTLGIVALVGYEYLSATARQKGINIPSTLQLVGMLPVASVSSEDQPIQQRTRIESPANVNEASAKNNNHSVPTSKELLDRVGQYNHPSQESFGRVSRTGKQLDTCIQNYSRGSTTRADVKASQMDK